MITPLGSITLGAAVPIAVTAQAAVDAAVGVSLPSVQAQIAGALAAQVALTVTPPSVQGQLDLALDMVAALQASISLPVVSVQLAGLATLLASLNAQLASLNVQVAFSASLSVLLGTAGLHAYRYDGLAGGLGEFQNVVPGGNPSMPFTGLLVGATTPETLAAMQQVFGI